MTKNNKVIGVTRDFNGDYANDRGKYFGWIIEFANGDKGENHSTDETKCKFVLNETADYEVIPVMSKQNPSEVWKYRIKYVSNFVPGANSGGGGNKSYVPRELPKEQQTSIACQVSYEVAIDYCVITLTTEVKPIMQKLTNWLVSKGLTGDIQKRACGCLRLAVRMMRIPKYANWTLEDLIVAANGIFSVSDPENFKPKA